MQNANQATQLLLWGLYRAHKKCGSECNHNTSKIEPYVFIESYNVRIGIDFGDNLVQPPV